MVTGLWHGDRGALLCSLSVLGPTRSLSDFWEDGESCDTMLDGADHGGYDSEAPSTLAETRPDLTAFICPIEPTCRRWSQEISKAVRETHCSKTACPLTPVPPLDLTFIRRNVMKKATTTKTSMSITKHVLRRAF